MLKHVDVQRATLVTVSFDVYNLIKLFFNFLRFASLFLTYLNIESVGNGIEKTLFRVHKLPVICTDF